jgi:hypothetical protein
MKKLMLTFVLAAVAIASAKSYDLKLIDNAEVNGTHLKAGDYRLEVKDQKVIITNGKQVAEAPVEVQEATEKYDRTSIRLRSENGQMSVSEIRLKGTNMKLVLNDERAGKVSKGDSSGS